METKYQIKSGIKKSFKNYNIKINDFLSLLNNIFIFLILINNYFIKKILLNQTGDSHQKLSTKIQVPLTGGVFILLSILFYLNQYEKIFIISIILIFF